MSQDIRNVLSRRGDKLNMEGSFLSLLPSTAGQSPSEETWMGNLSTDSLDLALKVLVSHLTWGLRAKLGVYEDGFNGWLYSIQMC